MLKGFVDAAILDLTMVIESRGGMLVNCIGTGEVSGVRRLKKPLRIPLGTQASTMLSRPNDPFASSCKLEACVPRMTAPFAEDRGLASGRASSLGTQASSLLTRPNDPFAVTVEDGTIKATLDSVD